MSNESEEKDTAEVEQELETETQESEEIAPELSELDTLKAALSASEDRYHRVHADFENIKKRLEKEKYQALEYSNEKFAKDLIPVIDALEGAIKAKDAQADTEPAQLLEKVSEGVDLTMKQFLSILEKHGVTPVPEDEAFDPNIHNAVQQMDSDNHETGEIVSTFQKGYKYKGRTLRDAMVIIAN
ncbi:nucleotide exchange factor GrpE [Sulfurimonas sp. MAG313]|nr:nucleotide exchange factor GrpE [Sulfurimonas sp. MAG313]MDF1881109.1 nucleotide exchange factor GrpE [Sulfurimonas sp. MAG313]